MVRLRARLGTRLFAMFLTLGNIRLITLLLTIITINYLTYILVMNLLLVLVTAFYILLNMMDNISGYDMIVCDGLFYLVLSRLYTELMFNTCFYILAMFCVFHEIFLA
jgi:hypothetical protein